MTIRYLFRCTAKDCGHVWARDYVRQSTGRELREYTREDGTRVETDPGADRAKGCVRCSARGVLAKMVLGVYSPAIRCDARCTEAVGRKCTCSCGGERHGQGRLIEPGKP